MNSVIDVRGLSCPQPVLLTKKALDEEPGKLQIIADNEVAVENITCFCKKQGYTVDVTKDGDDFRIALQIKNG